MKIKNLMCQNAERLLCFLLALLLLCAFAACGKEETAAQVHESKVIRALGLAEYGQYVYTGTDRVRRYNRMTGELSRACLDPECGGNCLLECGDTEILCIADRKLFFWAYPARRNASITYGYQDLITGEVKVLAEMSEDEGIGRVYAFPCGGYFYYHRRLLTEGGDPLEPDDYVDHICRVSLSGGKEEVLRKGDGETLVMAAEGYFVTMKGTRLIRYGEGFTDPAVIFDCEKEGCITFRTGIEYAGGRLYFLCLAGQDEAGGAAGGELPTCLVSVGLSDGSCRRVVSGSVVSFCLTDDRIYYSPTVRRTLYAPEDPGETPVVLMADASLHECGHDGSGDRIVYTNETSDYMESYTVIDGVLYGWIRDYDESAHSFGSRYFAAVDLKTGKTDAAVVKN